MNSGPSVEVVSSKHEDPSKAITDILMQIHGMPLAGGIIFCSHKYDWNEIAVAISQQMQGAPIFGCTSSGEINAAGYDYESFTFIAFPEKSFCIDMLAFDDIDNFDHAAAAINVRQLAANSRKKASQLGSEINQAALFLVDGLSQREELLAMTIQDSLGEITLIGGSAGDGMNFTQTGILYDGEFHTDSAIVVIISTIKPLHVFKAQHYQPGLVKAVITRAATEERMVYEINGLPAAQEYLRLINNPGVTLSDRVFATHPPMVKAGGDYFVRAIRSANDDGSLTFYCAIDEGMVLTIGEASNRITGLNILFDEINEHVGHIDHVIAFDCILNRIYAESHQIDREVSQIYQKNRVAGFNTYGEQFHYSHVNQTLSGLAIGK